MTELRACPFCGCEGVMEQNSRDQWFVSCRNEFCILFAHEDPGMPRKVEAAERWNCRAYPTSIDEYKTGLVDACHKLRTRASKLYIHSLAHFSTYDLAVSHFLKAISGELEK